MKNWYFHQHKQPLSDIHSISQNETIYQAKWTKSDLSKAANWTIIYGSHNEIKPHRILSPHSLNPSTFPPSFQFSTIHPIGCDHSLLPVESLKSKQVTNHLHPTRRFPFHLANQHPLHWINNQCVIELLHLDGKFIANNRNKHFLPSFFLCCTNSSVEYKDSSFTLTLFHFQSSPHSIPYKSNEKLTIKFT